MARSSYNRPPAGRAVSSRGVDLANGQRRSRAERRDSRLAVAGRRMGLLEAAVTPRARSWNNLFWTAAHHGNPPLWEDDLVVAGVL